MALTDKLSAIGNAIREKNGTTDLMTLEQMPQAIADIQSGGGDAELESKLFTLDGDLSYKFAYGGFDWLVNEYGDRIKVVDASDIRRMFYNSNVTEIPFNIHYRGSGVDGTKEVFSNASKLQKAPYVFVEFDGTSISVSSMFFECPDLREIPYDFFEKFYESVNAEALVSEGSSSSQVFAGCCSLRKLPNISMIQGEAISYSRSLYYQNFQNCYCVEEICNIPVQHQTKAITSNAFSSAFSKCSRVKKFTFQTNDDGTPKIAKWKSQTISLVTYVGYIYHTASETKYPDSIGLTRVLDEEGYQQYKDTDDWYTPKVEYSRYNHDSAVETINSLPDTSAYLAENGGTNTIKFKGQSGELTDGGAINTLTEEEIAVATAKGWTVTLS